jgi:hypothetical protein
VFKKSPFENRHSREDLINRRRQASDLYQMLRQIARSMDNYQMVEADLMLPVH